MKLIAKAKPVKIRIKSGNEEHSSLESLRKNFVWDEIKELLDGSLQRWLERIGASDIAARLSLLQDPKNDFLGVYNILFRGNKPLSSFREAFEELDKDKYSFLSAKEIISGLSIEQSIHFAHNYRNQEDILSLLKSHILNHVGKLLDEESENDHRLFEIGKLLNNIEGDSRSSEVAELANKCMIMAAKKGNESAKVYIGNQEDNYKKEFWDFYLRPETKEKIEYSWAIGRKINIEGISECAKNLFGFSNTCLEIFKLKQEYPVPNDYYIIAEKAFGKVETKDSLYEEKMFVLALLNQRFNNRINFMKDIENYPPAHL